GPCRRRRQAAQDRLDRRETTLDRGGGGTPPRRASGHTPRPNRNSRVRLAGKTARQNPTPTNRWRNSTSSWSRGSKTTSASDRPAESSRELGTLQVPIYSNLISICLDLWIRDSAIRQSSCRPPPASAS